MSSSPDRPLGASFVGSLLGVESRYAASRPRRSPCPPAPRGREVVGAPAGAAVRRPVVAHRLSTVRHAHRIWVIDGGDVAEAGTHDELLARDGAYAALWRVQTGAGLDLQETS